MNSSQRILLSGGTGFLGTLLARQVVDGVTALGVARQRRQVAGLEQALIVHRAVELLYVLLGV